MNPARPVDDGMAIFEADDGSEIAEIWKQVKIRVVQLAGGDERKLKQGIRIEDVQKTVEQAQASDKKASEKYGMFWNIFNKTLQCISHVGGVIASGASQVFPPPLQCLRLFAKNEIGLWSK